MTSISHRIGHVTRQGTRWLKRATIERGAAGSELWERDVPAEVEFWREYLETHGSKWPEEYAKRVDPQAPLDEPLIRDRLERFDTDVVSILDVGAGPLTILGKTDPAHTIEITPVDPLAEHYDRALADAGIEPIVRTLKGSGEDLVATFGSDRFDVAYARNSIDHSVNPLEIIRGMVEVVRPGGFVALRHYQEEAASTGWMQLHQWNFKVEDGELIIWGRDQSHNVTRELADQVTVECRVDPDSDKTPWILATLDKHPASSG